jgi:putative PIN family toxin of toxin-antitoxin system
MNNNQSPYVVLDTNIYVSALIKPDGRCAQITVAGFSGKFQLITSANIIRELHLTCRKESLREYIQPSKALQLVHLLVDEALIVDPVEFANYKYASAEYRLLDRKDEHVYRAYKTANADYLVTGDTQIFPTEKGIVSPGEFPRWV